MGSEYVEDQLVQAIDILSSILEGWTETDQAVIRLRGKQIRKARDLLQDVFAHYA